MILASSQIRQGHIRKGHLRGFTLIELLVVIAIIGILSAVVLASLNTARAKGTDASIKSDLNTVQTQAALDYDAFPNSYGASIAFTSGTSFTPGTGAAGTAGVGVFTDSTAGNALSQAATQAGTIYYGTNGTAYFVAATMKSTTGYWCVDSTGNAKTETAAPTSAAYGTNFVCP
ncbi:MAG: type II secretion system protein [Candidatus Pacebacteria bacterium]|nr:type II secretion system protein [Candidatus Paceibacterota bacterium]